VRGVIFLRRKEAFLFILFGILSLVSSSVSAEIITGLEIPNAPPFLLKDIPNQSWQENQSNLNAFDLDDYFEDPENVSLSYYNSSVEDVYVSINSTSHEVSFIPNPGFRGTRNVTFYASDSVFDTLSNIVMLFVGLDTSPPQWYSPVKDKTTIYQNDIVSFSANWTDDRELSSYIFSINQGAGWYNLTAVNFSGLENFSIATIQIMAPGLNSVYWRFYANDSSGNMNVTDVQSFLVASQGNPSEGEGETTPPPEEEDTGGLVSRILTKIELERRKAEGFQLSASEFRVSLKQGTFKTRVLKITNTGLEEINISVSSQKISNFTVFSETNFTILPGKSKEITIDFNAPERAIPGQYFGYIKVQSNRVKKSLPTVLDIQGVNLDFDLILNISEGYELVKPGKNVKVNITLVNLKDLKQRNVSMYYAIKDYNGIVYNFSEENLVFLSSLNFQRELRVPEIAPEGKYLFYARASDEKNIAIDSIDFEVGNRFNFSSFLKIGSILILLIIFAILLSAFMVKYKRDKKRERLLELYIMLNKMKNLIKQNKTEEALKMFIRIKEIYHDPIPKEVFDDKEKLKKEIASLYEVFAKDSKDITKPKEDQESKKTLKDSLPKEKGEKQ
jgi:hypothetical protein